MKHLNTTKCCDHTFTANDIDGRLMSQKEALGTNDVHLYGGHAERFAYANCPQCSKRYVMWMKRKAPNFRILTISEVESGEETQTAEPARRGRRTREQVEA